MRNLVLVYLAATANTVRVAALTFPSQSSRQRIHAAAATKIASFSQQRNRPATPITTTTTLFSTPAKKRRPRPSVLTHERDFFRQEARLDSLSAYVLVSTLTASMSFGCLVGFNPIHPTYTHILYRALCLAIQMASGMSSLLGIYATIVFSLTILYCRSALGAERDREYDIFLRRTTRARVDGQRCFSWSLGTFSLQVWLVLVERTSQNLFCSFAAGAVAAVTFFYLYRDWQLLHDSKEIIYD